MSQAVKRACDACHRRKVKCDGINPCRNCSTAQLSCTYNAIPQKKGPKGSRAKVISELRENQRQTSLSAKVQSRINGGGIPPPSPSLSPSAGLVSNELVKDCVNFYFDNLYAQIPILDRYQVEQQMLSMDQQRDTYCLLTALCAFMMLQPGMTMPANDAFNFDMHPGATIISSQLLLEECLRVRKGYDYQESINPDVLATNFFIVACCYGTDTHEKAWYYLREATTMIHLCGMHDEKTYANLSPVESARRRRLYWSFLVFERAYAVMRNYPLTLKATIRPPQLDDPNDPYAPQLSGFNLLVNLFQPFDEAAISLWNNSRRHLTAPNITAMQKQLNSLVQPYLCRDPHFTDFSINQNWLKNAIWQLNGPGDDSMSFQYPMDMSREFLMTLASAFPSQGAELINTGLFEKLFQTCSTMMDLLALQPASRDPYAVGPREHLNQLLSIIAIIRNGDARFMPLLLSRVIEVLPRLASPMLQNAPENPNLANIDIFDGFGSGGIAQPPPQMQMPMDTEYGQKYDDYEKKYSMDMGGGTPDSGTQSHTSNNTPPVSQQGTDMNTSFVSSPGVMSTAGDYTQSINGFGMSEMVMSPMGNTGQSSLHGMQNQQLAQQVGQVPDGMCQPQMGGMTTQGMQNQGMNTTSLPASHSMPGVYNMRQARQGSFQMQNQQPMRTVGDFQGLQRAGTDVGQGIMGINTISNDMDFNTMR